VGGIFHFIFSFLWSLKGPFSDFFSFADDLQLGLVASLFVITAVNESVKWRRAVAARKANELVENALKSKTGSQNVAEISTDAVLDSVKTMTGTSGVNDEQLKRLVEQRRQDLLFDDEYFQAQLGALILTYLQPLPRSAKRMLNCFRVNALIAYHRGLFTSDPKVTVIQVGKWLVLTERWPLLKRSLAAAPDKMKTLEELSNNEVRVKSDPFMDSIKTLSPAYAGDEDLRSFIKSDPKLSNVLGRLSLSD
jgi:hypothetical protein